jgi:hypothetical protein
MEKLLQKLAWKYARQAFNNELSIDFEELMAEANLAYLEALRTHDEEKGKVTTHIWNTVSGHLQNYIKEEMKHKHIDFSEVDVPKSSVPYFEKLSKEAQSVAKIVIDAPEDFIYMTKEDAKGKIIARLMNNGIDFKKIWRGIEDLTLIYS